MPRKDEMIFPLSYNKLTAERQLRPGVLLQGVGSLISLSLSLCVCVAPSLCLPPFPLPLPPLLSSSVHLSLPSLTPPLYLSMFTLTCEWVRALLYIQYMSRKVGLREPYFQTQGFKNICKQSRVFSFWTGAHQALTPWTTHLWRIILLTVNDTEQIEQIVNDIES